MKIKNSIKELWEKGFFEKHRSIKEINSKMLKDCGTTCSNTAMILKNCKDIIRKEAKGWIQKIRYSEMKMSTKKQADFFRLLDIHPEILKVSKKLFLDRHYAQAIFEAFKRVNNLVKEKSGRKDLDGKSLMLNVFSPNNPILKFNDLVSQTEKDEQEGFMYLFAGAILGIRNPKAHDHIVQKNMIRTLEYLIFASLLSKRVEEAF